MGINQKDTVAFFGLYLFYCINYKIAVLKLWVCSIWANLNVRI